VFSSFFFFSERRRILPARGFIAIEHHVLRPQPEALLLRAFRSRARTLFGQYAFGRQAALRNCEIEEIDGRTLPSMPVSSPIKVRFGVRPMKQ